MNTENETKGSGNRVVLITGGSKGIGWAMAQTFAQHGDHVVIIGRHEDSLRVAAEALGSSCSWQQADVSQSNEVTAAVNAITARLGKIDVLINNAGYSGFERGMNTDMSLEEAEKIWDDQIRINLTGAFLMSLAVATY